ncbi:MAG: hypothetical protein ABL901_18720 [Hyphomicrobiaceae bacterium]
MAIHWRFSIAAAFAAAMGGVVYYDTVYRVVEIKKEVNRYVAQQIAIEDVAMRAKGYQKSRKILADFFSEKRKSAASFADYMMKNAANEQPKDEKQRPAWAASKFQQFYFSPEDLNAVIGLSAKNFTVSVDEGANNLARRIDSDYGFDSKNYLAVNNKAITEKYKSMVDYSRALMDLEASNAWSRFAVSAGTGVLAGEAVRQGAKALGGVFGGWAELIGLAAGFAIDSVVSSQQEAAAKQKLIASLDKMMFDIENRISHELLEPMETGRNSQVLAWKQDLNVAIAQHRIVNRPRLVDLRLVGLE